MHERILCDTNKLVRGLMMTCVFSARSCGRLLATTMLATTMLATGAAIAQTPADEGAGSDIIVTAQRRAERLQDVPLSVSAISGEALKNAQVTTPERLEQLLPGVRMGRSGNNLRPAIRGTYTENVAVNGDPRIGIYVDEIYQSRPMQIPPIVDLERVELQKGPQGTLFGRNSFGGNITFTSALPNDTLSGGADVSYGRYNHYRSEGYFNLPLGEDLAVRVAALGEKSDGYVKNLNPLGNDQGDEDQWFVRGTLRFSPKSMDDRLEVILRGSYFDQGGAGLAGFGYKEKGVLVDPTLITAPGGSLTRGGVTYSFPNGFNGQSFTGQQLLVDSRYRDGIADINGVDVGIPVLEDPYAINFAGKTFRITRQQQYSGSISYDAGPVRLRSITSYTDFKNITTGNSLTPVQLNFSYIKTKAKTFTQELQLLSNDKASPFQYIIGGYYYDDNITEQNVTNVNRSYVTANAPAGQQYYTFGFTALPAAAQGLNQTFGFDSFTAYQQKIRSLAAYGQLSYTFAEKLTVTGGIRYTSDRKTQLASRFNRSPTGAGAYFVHSIDDPVNYTCGGFIAANAASPSVDRTAVDQAYNFVCNSLKQNFVTYRGAIDYKFNRDHMVYGSVSTGTHSGGFNTGVVNLAGVNTLIAFAPEYVTAYEIGSKNSFADGKMTLNIAAFLNNYRDLQAQTSIPNPANPAAVLALVQNIGRDRAYGLDIESTIRPDRHWTFNLAFNYLHAREIDYAVNTFNFGGLGSFCNVTPSCVLATGESNTVQGTPFPNSRTDPNRFVPVLDPSGNPIVIGGVPQVKYVIAGVGKDGTAYTSRKAFSPDYTVQVGASYMIDLGDAGSLTPEVQSYFSSNYILTDLTPNFGNQEAFTRTDLRITYRSADDRFRLQAFVNNVEDQAVITRAVYGSNRTLQVHYAIPRTYGVSAGVKF